MQATRARRLPVVIAVLAGVLASLLLAAGAGALYAEHQKEDGWFTTSDARFSTDSRALATESLDMDLEGFDAGLAGKARLQVTSAAAGPMFAGIAPTQDVERFLAGTDHATLTDVDTSPFRAATRTVAGDRTPADPAAQDMWSASTSGTGTQTLEWDIEDGDWSAVVMNADGSSGVDVRASAGANASFLQPLGLGLLGGALVLSLLAAGLVAWAVRTDR
jgi:zinc transporter ZupT